MNEENTKNSDIFKGEDIFRSNEEIIRHNIYNIELQPNMCDF